MEELKWNNRMIQNHVASIIELDMKVKYGQTSVFSYIFTSNSNILNITNCETLSISNCINLFILEHNVPNFCNLVTSEMNIKTRN